MFIRVKGAADPSPTLHHPSPWLFLGCEIISEPMFSHLLWSASAIYYDQLQPSIMTSFCLQWWLDFVIRWRVGEGWWRVEPTLHLSQPQCLSGFPAKRWRVKGKIESKVFTGKTTFSAVGEHIPNGDGRPPENFLPTHHFVPGKGKKLPQLRAILCHS